MTSKFITEEDIEANQQQTFIVNAMLEGLSDMLPDTNKAHGGGWLQDWLKNFMWEYGLDPADLLMEEKDESNEKEISR